MSQLRRQLISLQKKQNQNAQIGPYARASAANMQNTTATTSKSANRPKTGGSAKFAPKSSALNPSGAQGTPLSVPKSTNIAGGRARFYKQPANKTGQNSLKGKNVKKSGL
jgi:hypothetical protein